MNMDYKNVRKSKAPPVIRQTRTSAYRILKSNPLMMYDKDSVKKMGIEDPQKIPKSVLGISSCHNINSQLIYQTSIVNANNLHQDSLSSNLCKNQGIKPKIKLFNNTLKRPPNVINNKNTVMHGKDSVKSKKIATSTSMSTKEPVRQSISALYREQTSHPKRRSRSAEKFDPSKCFKRSAYEKANLKLETSRSMENISEMSLTEKNVSPVPEKLKITFKTPIAYDRRSIRQCTPSTGRKSVYRTFCSTPAPLDLQERLNNWLTKRGKSLGSFHHLKCFDLNENKLDISKISEENDENKENVTTNGCKNPEITSDHKVDYIDVKNRTLKDANFDHIARDALNDVHKLIQDGYPLDQCELWLSRIRQNYHGLDDEPLYWECRAALEQCRGNISSAVEHYRKAIVKGAKVDTIEDSLEQLLQKFSLLNIDPNLSERDTKNKKVILDARNTFKATIIQFAVQERMLKKKEEEAKKQIIVTPVRRSVRLSLKQSYNPSVKLCASIKEIDMNENTQFHSNSYLSIRYTP